MPFGCPFRCPGKEVAKEGSVLVITGPASAILSRSALGVDVIEPEPPHEGAPQTPLNVPPRHLQEAFNIALRGGAALLNLGLEPHPHDVQFVHLLSSVGLRVTTALAYVDFAVIRSIAGSAHAAAEHMADFAEAFEYTAAAGPALTLQRSTVEAEIAALVQPGGAASLPATEGQGLLQFVCGLLGLRVQDSVGLRPRHPCNLVLDCTDVGEAWRALWAAHRQPLQGPGLLGSNAADDDGCGDPGLPWRFFMVKQMLTIRSFTDIYKGVVEEDAEWVGQVYRKLLTTGTVFRLTDRYGRIAASCEKKESIFHHSSEGNLRYLITECSRHPRTRCADEREPCHCHGTVQFSDDGSGATPVSRNVQGQVPCTREAFGLDPASDRRKHCECVDDKDHEPWRIEADFDRLSRTSLFVWYNMYQGEHLVARVRKMAEHASEVLIASPSYDPDELAGQRREGQIFGRAEQDFGWFRMKFDVTVKSDGVPAFLHAFCAFTEFGRVRPDLQNEKPPDVPKPRRF